MKNDMLAPNLVPSHGCKMRNMKKDDDKDGDRDRNEHLYIKTLTWVGSMSRNNSVINSQCPTEKESKCVNMNGTDG